MKKLFIILLGISMLMPVMAQHKRKSQNIFPDGTSIPEWFLQSKVIPLDSLGRRYDVSDYGIVSDPAIVQTKKIQCLIDEAAVNGGGVIYFPEGLYKSGALFFKQGTHLYLAAGATLLGSENIMDFPLDVTRIEGETCNYFPALVNADGLDGFTISGKGTIDGNGTPYWKAFRLRRQWNPECTNKDEMRPRLVYISNSCNVQVADVTLQNSPYWTSHYYRCENVKIINVRYFSPKKPVMSASADGMDLDVCSNFLIKGCRFTVKDDAICFKGGKGPYADKDSTNGAVKNILVEDCFFDHTTESCITCGSEAVEVHNVLIRNCRLEEGRELLYLKMRLDTPQLYEHITVENITGSCEIVLRVYAWKQFFDLKGRMDIPKSYADKIVMRNIDLECEKFIDAKKNDDVYELSDFSFEDIVVEVDKPQWNKDCFKGISMKNVIVNGKYQ